MKRILITLLLVATLSGGIVAAEMRDSTLRTEAKSISVSENTLHSTLLQRNNRRRWRRRWPGRRWNRRWNNRRSNDDQWNRRRWNNRRGRRHGTH
ncbi:MAG TPA: hypothetical protein VF791_20175 [Pyrinomonadaceae bacterium]